MQITNPFHTVSGGNLTKYLRIAEKGDISGVGELWVIRCRAKVFLASSFGGGIQTDCGSAGW